MKKTYINPTLEVVKMNMRQQMLAGSELGIGSGDKSPVTQADGHSDDFDW